MLDRNKSRLFRLPACLGLACVFSLSAIAQQSDEPVIVRPGAPGQPTQVLPANTRPTLPKPSAKEIEFMQGMIHHHAQAVEMGALIEERTQNPELRRLGARISHSQLDEIGFMKRWLIARGESTSMKMDGMDMDMPGMDHSKHNMLMPGMLTPRQMAALKNAKGAEFDKLFLTGMIQHHGGALTMVKELYDTAGAGQDSEIFGFTTEVDSGQRAEIRIMQNMLGKDK